MYKNKMLKELSINSINYGSNLPSKHNLFIRIVKSLFSFEALFILFLFAWVLKANQKFQWIPIDLTLLLFILSVCTGILVFLGEKRRINKKSVMLAFSGAAFVLYILISLTWSAGHLYAVQKALYISTLTLWALLACTFIIAADKRRLQHFMDLFLIMAAWIAIESALEYIKGSRDVINALNSNYLALGYTIGIGLLISIAYAFFSEGSGFVKLGFLIITVFFMFILFVLGGRGPLISMIISLLIPFLYRTKLMLVNRLRIKKYFIFLAILLIAAVSTSIYLYLKDAPTATLARILLLFEPGMGTSAGTRAQYYFAAYKLWLAKPFLGHGIGSWPIMIGLPDMSAYPHNMLLEIMAELGLVGLLLFGFILFWGLRGLLKTKYQKGIFFSILIFMIFINAFTGAMFSGDINDNRIVFALLGLMGFEEDTDEIHKYPKETGCKYKKNSMLFKRVSENEK